MNWVGKIRKEPWELAVCDNCRFIGLWQEHLRFAKCPRCSHGLMYYVMDVSLEVKETAYLTDEIPPTEKEINAAIDKDQKR